MTGGVEVWNNPSCSKCAAARDSLDRAGVVEHPELIQRPILLLDDGTAAVGRTPRALDDVVRRLAASEQERPPGAR